MLALELKKEFVEEVVHGIIETKVDEAITEMEEAVKHPEYKAILKYKKAKDTENNYLMYLAEAVYHTENEQEFLSIGPNDCMDEVDQDSLIAILQDLREEGMKLAEFEGILNTLEAADKKVFWYEVSAGIFLVTQEEIEIIPNITEDTIIVPKVIATVLLSSAGKTKKCKCK